MKIQTFIMRILKKMIYFVMPKRGLPQNTIFINKNTWQYFNIQEYSDALGSKYTVVFDKIEHFKKDSLKNVVAYMGVINKNYLPYMTGLKWLQIASHGYNGFEEAKFYKNDKIVVTNMKDVFSTPIAQYCLSAYYAFNCYALRNLLGRVRLSDTKPNFTPTVTIIGVGNIGSKVAELAKSHGWTVYGIKRKVCMLHNFDAVGTFNDMHSYLSKSDYVINLLPETGDTRGIYNKDFFKSMKSDAIFCNVGRGASVDETALEMAVKMGIIRGAIVDASSGHKYKHRNIITTHHMSSVSPDNQAAIAKLYSAQLMRFLQGKELENVIPVE
jgi:D-2-hydroxyacid dehydrogenase (NADP+)